VWRKKTVEQDPSASRSSVARSVTGSACIYFTKWRERLRNSIKATGVSRVENLGVGGMVDYVIASLDRVNEASIMEKKKCGSKKFTEPCQ
jgi:hypothetical protein